MSFGSASSFAQARIKAEEPLSEMMFMSAFFRIRYFEGIKFGMSLCSVLFEKNLEQHDEYFLIFPVHFLIVLLVFNLFLFILFVVSRCYV